MFACLEHSNTTYARHLGCHTCWLSYVTLVYLWTGRTVARCTVTWLPNFLGWVDLRSCGAPQARAKRSWSSAKIDRQVFHPTCHLCGEREETVGHTAAECKKLAENQYKNCRHKVAQVVHWNLIWSAAKPCLTILQRQSWWKMFKWSYSGITEFRQLTI